MRKFDIMHVQGFSISIEDEYICLTDMAKVDGDSTRAINTIRNWLRNRFTLEFLGTWEQVYNPNFKVLEFEHFKNASGSNDFSISISQWVDSTQAIGIYSKKGKYGGTYAHKDIAFEFGSAISPVFKLYLIKEFQRLKEMESNATNVDWNIRRVLSKHNYIIQTDAVKTHKIPLRNIPQNRQGFAYAEEAEILNLALFGFTSRTWRESNLDLAFKNHNVREYASTNELTVLANLEGINAEYIKSDMSYIERLQKLKTAATEQLAVLTNRHPESGLRKNTIGEFQPYFKNDELGMFPAQPIDKGLLPKN